MDLCYCEAVWRYWKLHGSTVFPPGAQCMEALNKPTAFSPPASSTPGSSSASGSAPAPGASSVAGTGAASGSAAQSSSSAPSSAKAKATKAPIVAKAPSGSKPARIVDASVRPPRHDVSIRPKAIAKPAAEASQKKKGSH